MSACLHVPDRARPVPGDNGPVAYYCRRCDAPLSLAAVEVAERKEKERLEVDRLQDKARAEREEPIEWRCTGCPKRLTLPRWRAEARDYCTPACRKRAARHADHRDDCEGCGMCRKWDKAGT